MLQLHVLNGDVPRLNAPFRSQLFILPNLNTHPPREQQALTPIPAQTWRMFASQHDFANGAIR
jgi:hypothetical protein